MTTLTDAERAAAVAAGVATNIAKSLDALRTRPDRLELRWTDGTNVPRSATITARTTIGSSPALSVAITEPTVSRIHAEIEPRTDGWWIRDLGSRNGTTVNEVVAPEARIPEGASIMLGDTLVTVGSLGDAKPIKVWPLPAYAHLIGGTTVMRELFDRMARAANSTFTTLIHAETGTGKELVARSLHDTSPRQRGPFAVVDCAALPEQLAESELFGHVRGAFTGADRDKKGAIEQADGGTVFIDEVGELPLSLQPKLLRVLETNTLRRLGEHHYRTVDVRFVAATHRDLAKMVNEGRFREDLFFRLNVLTLTIPPLRERRGDIPSLIEVFAAKLGASVEHRVVDAAMRLDWPGNVRQLRHFVERVVAFGADDALATMHSEVTKQKASPGIATNRSFKELRDEHMAAFEKNWLAQMIGIHGRDADKIAKVAGVDKKWIYKLLKRNEL